MTHDVDNERRLRVLLAFQAATFIITTDVYCGP